MSQPPLLATKLHIPRPRPDAVPRSRLHELLGGFRHASVVLVSAPAGFGKTTLLTSWLGATADADVHTAWVSLDRGDSDPGRYWSYVIAAVRGVAPDVGAEAFALLRASPAAWEHMVGSLVNDLDHIGEEVVLVLDDYHVVESVEVHEAMRFLVDHLPQGLHLVVASRADPPWPLGGLRARGELLEIRAADLRFTAAETLAYFSMVAGLELTPADVDTLDSRTEGWVAALQLAALSLRGRDDPSAFVSSFAGDDRFVVDYLVDEVLDQQPDDVRRFLVETSILSRLSAALCAAVTGSDYASATLAGLERSNLFLIPLDDRRQWYRYHHLFGDVLRAHLVHEQQDRVADLHRRACSWLEDAGDRSEALRHAMAGGDMVKAAELVELGLPALRQARQDATLRQWIDALPDGLFANRPVLNLGRVGAQMVVGDVAGVEALLDEVEACLTGEQAAGEMVVHDQHEFGRLPAQTAMYRAGVALLRGDLDATIGHAERSAGLSGPDDHIGRGAASALIGLARWTGGDLRSAAQRYAESIKEFEAAGSFADALGCSLGLADMQVGLGQLGAAERTLQAGLGLAQIHGPLRGTPDMHLGLAEVHLERNELEAAAEQLRVSLDLGDWLALGQHAYRWRVVEARLRSNRGEHDTALDLLREAERCYDTDFSPRSRPVAATTSRLYLAAGDLTAAEDWVERADISTDDKATYLREYEHLTLARVHLATGRAPQVMPLLQRVLEAADAGGRVGAAVEAGALLALAHRASGDHATAHTVVGQVLVRAAPERLIRVFLDAGPTMGELLDAVVRHGPSAEQAAVLAEVRGGRRVASRKRDPAAAGLSAREFDVLRLLRTDLTGPEIAAELVVSLNTVRTHTKHIFSKLGATNRRAAVRRADELGI